MNGSMTTVFTPRLTRASAMPRPDCAVWLVEGDAPQMTQTSIVGLYSLKGSTTEESAMERHGSAWPMISEPAIRRGPKHCSAPPESWMGPPNIAGNFCPCGDTYCPPPPVPIHTPYGPYFSTLVMNWSAGKLDRLIPRDALPACVRRTAISHAFHRVQDAQRTVHRYVAAPCPSNTWIPWIPVPQGRLPA